MEGWESGGREKPKMTPRLLAWITEQSGVGKSEKVKISEVLNHS